jgi:hypothetical protein
MDVSVASYVDPEVSILRNLGSGSFASDVRVSISCEQCKTVRVIKHADLDGTGLSDEIILVVPSTSEPSYKLFAILDPLSPEPTVIPIIDSVLSMIAVGDWNEDGVSDIAFSKADLTLGILQSNP